MSALHSARLRKPAPASAALKDEMVDITFLIEFRTPDLDTQVVLAARVEIRGEHLLLLHSDGEMSAVFMLENVKSWSEVSPEVN